MKYSRNWLIELQKQTPSVDFLMFWGHQPDPNGKITASCLSQWWQTPFTVDNNSYATAEHWMMVGKAQLFGDKEILAQILKSSSPAEAKKLGRKVQNFDGAVWEQHKYELVKTGNLHKFGQNEPLKQFLLQTGQKVLVEASPLDTIWGIGLGKDNPNAQQASTWRGENLLGFALMEVRDSFL